MKPENAFENPGKAYRAIPFWSWNCRVTRNLIDGDLDTFVRMGFGGVCIHPRAGLDVPYLSDAFMNLVAYAVEGCEKRGLICWLYDDDRFPSGAADGTVTKEHPECRGKYLLMSEQYRADDLAAWSLVFEGGVLASYRRLTSESEIAAALAERSESRRVRFGYLAELPDQPWFEGAAYIDTTDPMAARAFINTTHERYFWRIGSHFGKTVQVFFTDEPRMEPRLQGKLQMHDPLTHGDFAVPYTPAFARMFTEKYGFDPLETVPSFVWQCMKPEAAEDCRRYREALSACFTGAFMDQLGDWCHRHHICFTGHVLGEDTLASQTRTVGEAMRCYREMDMPGFDVLADEQTWLAAVQAASVKEQMGKTGVMSELYGATDWDCFFLTYKLQGDWQAALGVTHRVPHLAHMSLEGEAKRDWPASIFSQSPWFERYRLLEDHFARLNTVLRRGKRVTRVALLHPVERMWERPMGADTKEESDQFDALLKRILTSLIDVQTVSESMLRDGLVSLESFDAVLKPEEVNLAELEQYRDVSVACRTHGIYPEFLYQLRQEGEKRWLFLGHTRNNVHDCREDNEIILRGAWSARLLDTWNGQVRDVPAWVQNGATHVLWQAYRDESLLLELRPGDHAECTFPEIKPCGNTEIMTLEPQSVRLTEPNAFILDFARYALNGGAMSEGMEILKLDNAVRAELGLPPRCENMRQPWAMEPGPAHDLTILYEFVSETPFDSLTLILERPEEQQITLNGVGAEPLDGYFIDRSFRKLRLSGMQRGRNKLVIRRKFTEKTNLEPMYLLGDFRVGNGRLAPSRSVTLGDLTRQGLPHYTGNAVYTFPLHIRSAGLYSVRIPSFAGPLADVSVDDGGPTPLLTTRPVPLGKLTAGTHTLTLTVYGSRYNLLSALHHAFPDHYWHGPDSWRTVGKEWTDEYLVKPAGLLGPIEILEEDAP